MSRRKQKQPKTLEALAREVKGLSPRERFQAAATWAAERAKANTAEHDRLMGKAIVALDAPLQIGGGACAFAGLDGDEG